MIEPMEGFAIVKKQKPKLNALNIYNDSQKNEVILDSDEYFVDVVVEVVKDKVSKKSLFNRRTHNK